MGWVLLGPTGKRAKIPPGETTQLGRGPLLELKDKRSSRRECDVTAKGDSLLLCPKRDKFMLLKKEGGKETAIQQDVEYFLGDGDEICFPQDNWYTVLYECASIQKEPPPEVHTKAKASDDEEEDEAPNVMNPLRNSKPAAIKKEQNLPAHRPSRAAARKVRTYHEEDEDEEEEEEEGPKKKKRRRMDSDSGEDSASGDDEYKPTQADDGEEDEEEFMDDDGPIDDEDEDLRPLCKYGTNCYRKNPGHLKEFRHPHLEKGTRDNGEDEEDSNEDVVDWDEEEGKEGDDGSEDEGGRRSRKKGGGGRGGGGAGKGRKGGGGAAAQTGGRKKRRTADDSPVKKPTKRAKTAQSPPSITSPPKHRTIKHAASRPKPTDFDADTNMASPSLLPSSVQSQAHDSPDRGSSFNQRGRILAQSTPSPPPKFSNNAEKLAGDEKKYQREEASHSKEWSLDSVEAGEKVSRERAEVGKAVKEGGQLAARPKDEMTEGSKLTEEEVAAAGPGAFSLGLPSLSTGVFMFDVDKAVPIACQVLSAFLAKHTQPQLRILFMDCGEPNVFNAMQKYADEHGLHDTRLQFVSADITKFATVGYPCRYIVNPTNWRFLGRGGGTNQSVHNAAGPALEQLARDRYKTAKTGVAYPVNLPDDSPLRVSEGVQCVINVVGPNMNPMRPDCLEGDYDMGCALLRQSYEAVLDCFVLQTRL